DRNLPSADTTVAAQSDGQVLPPANPIILYVASTTGFSPAGGTILVTNNAGVESAVSYTGINGNTFTGCTGGSGTLATGGAVTNGTRASATIGAASNGVNVNALPNNTIFVDSTSDFAASGTLHVATDAGTK